MQIKRRCKYCNKSSSISVNAGDYQKWQSGTKIQIAFPYLSTAEREMIQTGYHDACFDLQFAD